MKSHPRVFVVAFLACLAIVSPYVQAQFTVSASTGTVSWGATAAGSTGGTSLWDVDILYTGSSTTASAAITLRSTGTNAIRDITIETRTHPGYSPGTTIATLVVDGIHSGGAITGLQSIDWIAPTGANLPAVLQANIELSTAASPSGLLGSGTAKAKTLEAHAFTRIEAQDCNANVTVIQDALTSDGLFDMLLTGDMQGDVSCTYLRKM